METKRIGLLIIVLVLIGCTGCAHGCIHVYRDKFGFITGICGHGNVEGKVKQGDTEYGLSTKAESPLKGIVENGINFGGKV